MRDPLARLISQYDFHKKWPDSDDGRPLQRMPVSRYLLLDRESFDSPKARYKHFNLQTFMICGLDCQHAGSNAAVWDTEEPLRIAQANIRRCYVAVGTVEDGNATRAALSAVLPKWFPKNSAPLRSENVATSSRRLATVSLCSLPGWLLAALGMEGCGQKRNATCIAAAMSSDDLARMEHSMGHDLALYEWVRGRLSQDTH